MEKLQFHVQCKDISTLAELVIGGMGADGSQKLFELSAQTLPVSVLLILGPLHCKQSWENVDEDPANGSWIFEKIHPCCI